MSSPKQFLGISPAIQGLLSDNKTGVVTTFKEVGPSSPTAAVEEPKEEEKEDDPEKGLAKASMANVQKKLLNKWLGDCQRIISFAMAFVSSEMTDSTSQQQRDLLDNMKHDIGITQSAIEFVAKYDVKEYVNKEEAEAKLMEVMMLIRVQVTGMREVLMRTGCRNRELHALWRRSCDCFDLVDPFL